MSGYSYAYTSRGDIGVETRVQFQSRRLPPFCFSDFATPCRRTSAAGGQGVTEINRRACVVSTRGGSRGKHVLLLVQGTVGDRVCDATTQESNEKRRF